MPLASPLPLQAGHLLEYSTVLSLAHYSVPRIQQTPSALCPGTGYPIELNSLHLMLEDFPPSLRTLSVTGQLKDQNAISRHIQNTSMLYHDPYKPSPSEHHTPSRPFLAAHCRRPQFQRQRPAHWGLGRAGRDAGEPGPASGAAALAGSPRRVVPDGAAMRWSRTTGSPAPRLRHPPG